MQSLFENSEGYFVATYYKWCIISNRKYDKLREKEGFDGFADLEAVD